MKIFIKIVKQLRSCDLGFNLRHFCAPLFFDFTRCRYLLLPEVKKICKKIPRQILKSVGNFLNYLNIEEKYITPITDPINATKLAAVTIIAHVLFLLVSKHFIEECPIKKPTSEVTVVNKERIKPAK